jgi:hypothetical protein
VIDDEDAVRSGIQEMLRAGEQPRAPLTAAELRAQAAGRRLSHVDGKLAVTLAAAAVLIVALFASQSFRAGDHPASTSGSTSGKPGWVAHSAYGVQVSVPKSWKVVYFPGCPSYQRPGVLTIGVSAAPFFCPAYIPPGSSKSVSLSLTTGADPMNTGLHPPTVRTIRVHGLTVETQTVGHGTNQASTIWYVPSRSATLTGLGRGVLQVMQTLSVATSRAVAAPGNVTGSLDLETLQQQPVSGPVTVTDSRTGNVLAVDAVDGQYSFSGPPGAYAIQGHADSARCPLLTVTVRSGESITAPTILCQGF